MKKSIITLIVLGFLSACGSNYAHTPIDLILPLAKEEYLANSGR